MPLDPYSFLSFTVTASSDNAFRVCNDPKIILGSINIACYTNDAYMGNAAETNAILRANAVAWFDNPVRIYDLVFKNLTAGQNTQIVITGPEFKG